MKIINSVQDAIPVMIAAIIHGDVTTVNALLDKFPVLIDLKDKSGRNLIMMAAYSGDPGIVNYLVSFYVLATPQLDITAVDGNGLNAYDWAVLGGNEFARSLISKVMPTVEDEE